MRRVLGGLLVVSLLGAGCGSSKPKSAAKTTTTSSPTSTTASTVADGSGTSTTVKGGPNATGTGKGAVAPAGAAAVGGTGGSGGKAGSSGSSAKGGVQAAAPGTYTYNRTGKAHTSAFGDQSQDGPVTLKVDPVAGGDQHTVQSAQEGDSEQTVRLLAEGAYFTQLKQSTSGFVKEFRPDPPVLAVPSDPAVGREWSWTVTSTDGRTTLNAAFKVLRKETLAVGAEQVPTVVLSVVLKGSGDITFTTDSTNWVSLAKGLIVRTDQKTDGNIGSVTFTSQSSQILQGTKPA
jgi:hypothetical protein